MKQILFLIIIIAWSILQARRKAMREQRRREAAAATAPASEPVAATATPPASDWPAVTETPDRFLQQIEADVPESVRPLLEATRKRKRKKQAASDEDVERIVRDAPTAESAYDIVTTNRPEFSFNRDALRTFVVTREVLGAPRAKRPHRPELRNR